MSEDNDVRQTLEQVRAQGYEGIIKYLRAEYPGIDALGGSKGWRAQQYLRNPELLDRVHGEVSSVLDYFEQLGPEQGMNGLLAMLRYSLEGEAGTYIPDRTFYDFLIRRFGVVLTGKKNLLDLGSGNVAANLAHFDTRMGNPAGASRGIDLSGSFALMDNAELGNIHVGTIDAPLDELRRQLNGFLASAGLVVSSLTLDRVAKPAQLIENMHRLAFPGGKVVLGALLPCNHEDDEPNIANPIVYTKAEDRLTSGASVDGDVHELSVWIGDRFGVKVVVDTFPYSSKSSGMAKVYDTYRVFSWSRTAEDGARD